MVVPGARLGKLFPVFMRYVCKSQKEQLSNKARFCVTIVLVMFQLASAIPDEEIL